MCVKWCRFSRSDGCFHDSYTFILEKDPMVIRVGDHAIQGMGPLILHRVIPHARQRSMS